MTSRTRLKRATLLAATIFTLAACTNSQGGAASDTPGASTSDTPSSGETRTVYPVTVTNCGKEVTVPARPEHILGDQEQDAVPLFELGAGDRVKAIFSHYGGELGFIQAIDPEVVAGIEALPDLDGDAGSAYPVFELVLEQRADFIFQAYPDDAIGGDAKNQKALDATGVPLYTLSANCEDTASFDSHFTDLENLGKILDVQDTATALIAERKATLEEIKSSVGDADRPNTFLLDSFAEGGLIYTNTGAFTRDTITLTGGTPVPAPGPDRYSASLEEVAAADVEVLLVTHYGEEVGVGTDEERAQQWFDQFPNSPAAKNKRWAAVPYPGGPNAIAIAAAFAEAIHPETFSS